MTLYSFLAQSQISGGGLRALPAAAVTVYRPSTTVRAAIYDANGNALSNPGTADANGIFSFVAPEGAYDVVATLGSYLIQQTIQIVYAPTMKAISDASYVSAASDVGVTYTTLTASRTLTLPPLATMSPGKAFPVADESGNASATVTITVVPASGDLINGQASTTLTITTPYQTILPVAGTKSWML